MVMLIFYQARALKVTQPQPTSGGPVPPPGGKAKQLPPMDAKSAQQTDEILNSILPPRFVYFMLFCSLFSGQIKSDQDWPVI